MKRYLLIMLALATILPSCKETSDTTPKKVSVTEYFPLVVGTYWVYERSSCDSTWADCNSISIDTNRITKDTVINENQYFKLEGKNLVGTDIPVFLRDSNNYIVNLQGQIILTIESFDSILYERYLTNPDKTDTIFHTYNQMVNHPNQVDVPAGIFNCIDNRSSLFRKIDNFEKEYNSHTYYSKYAGLVYQNALFANSLGGLKRELISFEYQNHK